MKHKNLLRIFMAFLIVGVYISTGVGCVKKDVSNTSPIYNFGTDCQYLTASDQRFGYGYAETEDSFYYLDKEFYLHVIDKRTMGDSFLCMKPNCLHNKDDTVQNMEQRESCNACMGLAHYEISYYDGFLYLLRLDIETDTSGVILELTKVSLDGSSRKSIWIMEWEEDYQGIPSRFFMHRGKFYFQLDTYRVNPETGATESCGIYFYAYDLTKKQVKRLFGVDQMTWHFFAIGNYLYVSWIEDGDPETHIKTRYDLTTGEIIDFPHCLNVLQIGESLANYNIFAQKTEDGYTLTHTLEFYDLDGKVSQEKIVFDFDDTPYGIKQIQTDGEHLFVMDGIYGDCVRMYDRSTGKEIACVSIPEFSSPGNRLFGCTREGNLLLYTHDPRDGSQEWVPQFFYCDISAIGTPDFQWYEVEKVN